MPRATCRCGQKLSFPADGPDRVICPKCSARIRVRRTDPAAEAAAVAQEGDGFLRFSCTCGRRLKVRDTRPRPESGKCPDCGRIVPVPALVGAGPRAGSGSGVGAPRANQNDPESPTVDLDPDDLAELARWSESYQKKPRSRDLPGPTAPMPAATPAPADADADEVDPFADPWPGIGMVPGAGSEQFPVTETFHPPAPAAPPNPSVKMEAGLRVCPRCGRPIHLGAETCRQCGAHVPRR